MRFSPQGWTLPILPGRNLLPTLISQNKIFRAVSHRLYHSHASLIARRISTIQRIQRFRSISLIYATVWVIALPCIAMIAANTVGNSVRRSVAITQNRRGHIYGVVRSAFATLLVDAKHRLEKGLVLQGG